MITTNRMVKTDYNGANLAKEDIKINGENLLSANFSTRLKFICRSRTNGNSY